MPPITAVLELLQGIRFSSLPTARPKRSASTRPPKGKRAREASKESKAREVAGEWKKLSKAEIDYEEEELDKASYESSNDIETWSHRKENKAVERASPRASQGHEEAAREDTPLIKATWAREPAAVTLVPWSEEPAHHRASSHRSLSPQASVLILRLAVSGSVWFTDLMNSIAGTTINGDITSLETSTSTNRVKKKQMDEKMKEMSKGGCQVCGWSSHTRNPFTSSYLSQNRKRVKVIVFLRSNMVSYAFGLYRAKMLRDNCHFYSSPKLVNETRSWDYRQCNIPLSQIFPIRYLEKNLIIAAVYQNTHLGFAYQNWKCGDEVYEMYYEALLADKKAALTQLFDWLGQPDLITDKTTFEGKTIKYTSSDLRSAIINYNEVYSWLRVKAPCYVPHLESNGREVLKPCDVHFNLTELRENTGETYMKKDIIKVFDSLVPKGLGFKEGAKKEASLDKKEASLDTEDSSSSTASGSDAEKQGSVHQQDGSSSTTSGPGAKKQGRVHKQDGSSSTTSGSGAKKQGSVHKQDGSSTSTTSISDANKKISSFAKTLKDLKSAGKKPHKKPNQKWLWRGQF